MALSRSIQKGQAPIKCHLCETETNIKWKCLDCELLICTKCKEFHGKIKTSKEHKIIDIREVGKHTTEIDFTKIKCQKHGGEVYVMFCKSCNKLVCPMCIAEVHEGHGLLPIIKSYEFHIGKLRERLNRLKSDKNILDIREKQIWEIRKQENKKYKQTRRQIQINDAALKKKIDHYTEKLIKDLDEKWERLQNVLDKEEESLSSVKQKINYQQSKSEEIIHSNNIEILFKEFKALQKSFGDVLKPKEIEFPSIPKFISGEITSSIVGSLQDTTDVKINILQQYTTDISHISYLSSNPDGSLWIGCNTERLVQRVHPDGSNLTLTTSYNMTVHDMALTPSNDLIVIDIPYLKQINGISGRVTNSKYSVDPLFHTAVHTTKDGKILDGAMEPGPAFPASGRRVLFVLDREGQPEHSYENNQSGQRIFTYISNITSIKTGTTVVIDTLSDKFLGRVLILGQEGYVLNIYRGNPAIHTEQNPFRPFRVVTTPADNVIVSDPFIHILHILNSHGNPITYHNTQDIGISDPISLSYNKSGHLYIGCGTNKGSKDKAELYIVTIPEC